MINVKTVLRIGGVVILAIGLMFVPVRNYVFDAGDLSAFDDVTELGGFVWVAVLMIVVGLVAIGLSFLVRGEMSD